MRRLCAAFLLFIGLANAALAQQWPTPAFNISITGTVAASTRIITAPAGKQIIITSLMQVPVATSVVTYIYGTGTNCGTGTTSLTGAMTFAAGQVLNMGSGIAPIET